MSNLVEMFKGKRIEKADYKRYDIAYTFGQTIDNIKKYSGIPGIENVLDVEYDKYREYQREYNEIVKDAQVKNSEQYSVWEDNYKKKNICKLIFAICLIIVCMCMHFNKMILLFFLSLITCIGAGIVAVVYKLITMDKENKYNNYTKTIYKKLDNINNKYTTINYSLYNEADNIYLNSLEPTHRETVLMRRDQERQHQERLAMEQKILDNQKAAQAEGKKLRETQEQLLGIEKEREKRYWNSRY